MTQPRLGVEPTALPPTDLATVFGRSSTLRGRLQPIRDTTRPPSSPDAPAPNMPKIAKSGATKRSGPKADSPPAGQTATRGVIASLPLSLRERYLRLNAENLQVLDQLTEQYKAPSRSALITAALGSYLDQASN